MVKVKHERTAEFVVGGFRCYRAGGTAEAGKARKRWTGSGGTEAGGTEGGGTEVGRDRSGRDRSWGRRPRGGRVADARAVRRCGQLCHVGVIGAFPAHQRRQLVEVLAPYRLAAGAALEDHPWAGWALAAEETGPRMPGARSRWNATKDLSFEPLRPDLVVEAAYEHLQGDRLRHTAQFRRWRPDRSPTSCTYEHWARCAVPAGRRFRRRCGPGPDAPAEGR